MGNNNNLPAVKKEGLWNRFMNFFRKKTYNAVKTGVEKNNSEKETGSSSTYPVYDSKGNLVYEIKLGENQRVINETSKIDNVDKEVKINVAPKEIEKTFTDSLKGLTTVNLKLSHNPEHRLDLKFKEYDGETLGGGGSAMANKDEAPKREGEYVKVDEESKMQISTKVAENISGKVMKATDTREVCIVEVETVKEKDGIPKYIDVGKWGFRIGTLALLTGILISNLKGCTIDDKEPKPDPNPNPQKEDKDKGDKIDEEAKKLIDEIDEMHEDFLESRDILEGMKHKINEENKKVNPGEEYYDQEEMEVESNESRDEHNETYNEIKEELKDFKYKTRNEQALLLQKAYQCLKEMNESLAENYEQIAEANEILQDLIKKHQAQLEEAGIDYNEQHGKEIENTEISIGMYSEKARKTSEVAEKYYGMAGEVHKILLERGDDITDSEIEKLLNGESITGNDEHSIE